MASTLEPPHGEVSATSRLFSKVKGLFIRHDQEHEKRRTLRRIAKYVKKSRPRMYDPRQATLEPPLAELVHEFYLLFAVARSLFERDDLKDVLKAVVLNASLSDRQLEIKSRTEENVLRERVAEHSFGEVVQEVKSELALFVGEFKADKMAAIESTYHNLRVFFELVRFDYIAFLQCFDSKVTGGGPKYIPGFVSCEGKRVADLLIRFAEVTNAIDPSADWNAALKTMKEYKGFEIVPLEKWMRALRKIASLQDSRLLVMVLKLIEEDPVFEADAISRRERIVTPYLSKYKLQVALGMEKIQREIKTKRIGKLLREIFEDREISELSYYTQEAGAKFTKKGLPGYRYTDQLRYTKAFLTDFYKPFIRELIRSLVIKGEWKDTSLSRHLSDCDQMLADRLNLIRQIDAGLAEDKPIGVKLKEALYRMMRNKANKPVASRLIDQINTKAGEIIRDTVAVLVKVAEALGKIHADFTEEKASILYNREAFARQYGNDLCKDIKEMIRKIESITKIVHVQEI